MTNRCIQLRKVKRKAELQVRKLILPQGKRSPGLSTEQLRSDPIFMAARKTSSRRPITSPQRFGKPGSQGGNNLLLASTSQLAQKMSGKRSGNFNPQRAIPSKLPPSRTIKVPYGPPKSSAMPWRSTSQTYQKASPSPQSCQGLPNQ
jgi:hypothetical protein